MVDVTSAGLTSYNEATMELWNLGSESMETSFQIQLYTHNLRSIIRRKSYMIVVFTFSEV